MTTHIAKQIHMLSRPEGTPSQEHFAIVDVDLPAPAEGQVLVKNHYMSVDPYMRGRMRAQGVYAEPYALNKAMWGGAVGEIVESNAEGLKAGDTVLSGGAWQDKFVADGSTMSKLTPFDKDKLSLYLGTLGMPGMTAYVGLFRFGEPKAGETVFVSAASGAVGANVCQIAKRHGCRVIGSVGSNAKAQWLLDECGVDEVINYKTCGDLTKALAEAAPDGVDVYFENVGGEHLQAAINVMNPYGRIAACGMISSYNQAQPIPGPNNLMLIVGKKIRINGFIVFDHNDMRAQFLADMESWVSEGQIKTKETIVEGLDNAVDAFLALFTGDNFGKMIVKF
ncbi:NADP-dependent oxidoreductase [Gammaproteobacteria bacterium]|nr:NADP-dependent oxidoreductase [Gammaproteobacteria bacterium]MAX07579.1 NADP-dependent oxidoreductase [Gammaproteobacteria bacterium]MDC0221199.1 NADP-dependent oxidoreductase [Gammaproteobacteria bacterium]|tara:strand:- start:69 stop:1079 length:1011 start_codon:yes stop_codon:yes gene_type:complete